MRHLLATTARIGSRTLRSASLSSRAALGLKQRRHYTNTSVYTRMDSMSPEEHLKVLLEEQQYLIELLKTDDSQAPWCKQNVITVSREVQYGLHEPQDWFPDQIFDH
ncbi:hypothetical protein GGI13_001072 [Coemansia sp. RSA 455]|nr:hypothetical protein H4S03_008554 [Coemansia sp. S3946]KAJ2039373.1 hypothetical protein GGI08_008207 [Coemansia sp. S2]KAJ2106943.1 hypothetical protein GGI16_001728 [Coemansia sp. S142-1]KAJ2110233.1 hypothetical protein IW146_005995 [Coemansia sp. RSA 922]KAJ2256829.1 hypothetical protein GGI13_001072 [Coemansia sp. RSA 455]KAJ2334472.1 hypothetical protein GGH92_008310 [Coemansia sp. RSA 2673]